MSIEISEIGIRIAVGEAEHAAASDGFKAPPDASAPMEPSLIEEIVQRCVRDVLATLRLAEER